MQYISFVPCIDVGSEGYFVRGVESAARMIVDRRMLCVDTPLPVFQISSYI
jgi:hypothetical protein